MGMGNVGVGHPMDAGMPDDPHLDNISCLSPCKNSAVGRPNRPLLATQDWSSIGAAVTVSGNQWPTLANGGPPKSQVGRQQGQLMTTSDAQWKRTQDSLGPWVISLGMPAAVDVVLAFRTIRG